MTPTTFVTYTTDLLVKVAARGWTPAALRHHLTKTKALPLLDYCMFLAKEKLPERVSSEVRYHWHVEADFAPKESFSSSQFHTLWEKLRTIPYISSEDLRLTEKQEGASDLPPEQVKAQRKITALLRKAESTPYEEEAATYIQKAAALQTKYNISAIRQETPRSVRTTRLLIDAPYVREKALLLTAIARNCGAQVIALTNTGIMCVVGYPADLAYIKDMYASLERQCMYFMVHSPRADRARENGSTTSFRRSFIIAYAREIADILASATRGAKDGDDDTSQALMETSAAVEDTFSTLYPEVTTSQVRAHNAAGYEEGTRSAQSSHFGGDSSGVGGRRSLGA